MESAQRGVYNPISRLLRPSQMKMMMEVVVTAAMVRMLSKHY